MNIFSLCRLTKYGKRFRKLAEPLPDIVSTLLCTCDVFFLLSAILEFFPGNEIVVRNVVNARIQSLPLPYFASHNPQSAYNMAVVSFANRIEAILRNPLLSRFLFNCRLFSWSKLNEIKYLIIHFSPDFSGIIYSTVWETLQITRGAIFNLK